MKIHHLRNATFVIEAGSRYFLIDPMLSRKGQLPPFSYFRHRLQRNPIVELPDNASDILEKVTHCIVTHSQKWGLEFLTHTDHLDGSGKKFLRERQIPVLCLDEDAGYMRRNGITVERELSYWQSENISGGKITAVPTRHGHSWMHHFMANGAGIYLELKDEPSIYISGDTVYTDDVKNALTNLKPDISVVAAGSAGLDVGGHILMSLEEILTFIETAPGKVIANHLEALNHCPMTRKKLTDELDKRNLMSKIFIPDDGDVISFEKGYYGS